MVYRCIEIILQHLYPPTCLLCGAPGEAPRDLCAPCRADLPVNEPACGRCGLPVGHRLEPGTLCGQCQRDPPRFERCVSPLLYRPPVSDMVGRFKFNDGLAFGRLLAQLLADAVDASGSRLPELLVPVPLHAARLRERGFNQAALVARDLSRRFGLPVDTRGVRRVIATPPQSRLGQPARARNLRGAFELVRRPAARHVALVDDVVTTGATVNALATVLLNAGVERVDVWSCARTP